MRRYIGACVLIVCLSASAQLTLPVGRVPRPGVGGLAEDKAAAADSSNAASGTYLLSPSDVILVKVYQEPDLESQLRIGKDGTITFPLIGVVNVGGRTVDEAGAMIRQKLDQDYLVNPHVSVSVIEYSKRRFTVLGQVHKPGSFEIPNEEKITLLQAIAMAGGYTRLANQSSIVVSRGVDGKRTTHTVNAKSAAHNAAAKPFEILPGDTVTVPERVF